MCIATYQRPEGLKRLLEGLNKLAFDWCETPDLKIIVVDNDSAGHARALCEELRSSLRWPLKCSIEPRRGIPYARNRSVACAQEEHVDFVAFLDDDEVPEPSWLDELLFVQRLYDADVVGGPVLPHFTVPVPTWMTNAGFFERRRLPTGSLVDWAGTNNVLVRSQVFENMDKIFDERFALSGGSDRDFFTRAHQRGYKIVWADDALVYEWVPESRAKIGWLLQRHYRYGNTHSLRNVEAQPSVVVRARLAAEAGKHFVRGLLRLSRSVAIDSRNTVKIGRDLWRLLRKLRALSKILGEVLIRNLRSLRDDPRSLLDVRRKLRSLIILLQTELPPLFKILRRNARPLVKVKINQPRLLRSLHGISRGAGVLAGAIGNQYEEYRRTHGE